jgi:HAD superfamily hydrolase (TIGR01549 family)
VRHRLTVYRHNVPIARNPADPARLSGVTATIHHARAWLFDMDGTITRPVLDFDLIRAEMGVKGPILEAMATLPPDRFEHARTVLDRHETRAAEESELNEGVEELLSLARQQGVKTALITRNSARNVKIVLARHGLRFDVLLARDFEPTKPHPAPLIEALRQLDTRPDEALMIGDGSHDVQAGVAAGVRTVWVSHGLSREFDPEPWISVDSMQSLLTSLQHSPFGISRV